MVPDDDDEAYEDEEDLQNDQWFKENYYDLIEQHPREWIAVAKGKIVSNGATRIEVEDKARDVLGSDEFSVYFVPPVDRSTDITYATR